MHGAAAGDIDSDGDSDIVAVSFDGILFFENNGLVQSRLGWFWRSVLNPRIEFSQFGMVLTIGSESQDRF